MTNILDSPRIIDVSGLGPNTLTERYALGAAAICMTRLVWDRAVEPAINDKRFIPNRLSSLCAHVIGHLERAIRENSGPEASAATPFFIALNSYDEDGGHYQAGGLENTNEFPYPAAIKIELCVYHTLCRPPYDPLAPTLALLITLKGEDVPEFSPAGRDEIRAALYPSQSTHRS